MTFSQMLVIGIVILVGILVAVELGHSGGNPSHKDRGNGSGNW